MADEIKTGNEEEQLTDIDIAEQANKLLKGKDKEIADLKKQLAQMKLLQQTDDSEEEERMTEEECMAVILNPNASDYDIVDACAKLAGISEERGDKIFGPHQEEIKEFFEDVIESCNGDKSRFNSVYQSLIGADPKEIAAGFPKRR